MIDVGATSAQIQNIDRPFTELFSLLRRDVIADGHCIMRYDIHDLKIIYQHTDNAIDNLIQGIQDLGCLLASVSQNNQVENLMPKIGFLIADLANLTDALNGLRSDVDFTLRVRDEVVDF